MKPKFITFTGFDDRTNISDMVAISRAFPVEWGVLASPTDKDARFPSRQAIEELCENKLNLSLHCCGSFSKGMQVGTFPNIPIRSFDDFRRMQINGCLYSPVSNLLKMAEDKNFCDIIIQCEIFNDLSKPFLQLFDISGGRGLCPDNFPKHPGYFVGYAGGINPENISNCIKLINAPENTEYWIDMETGVRTDGWFDLDKVIDVCKAVYR